VPNVQWKTPDDGQRKFPKHVDFLDKNKFGNISASVDISKNKNGFTTYCSEGLYSDFPFGS